MKRATVCLLLVLMMVSSTLAAHLRSKHRQHYLKNKRIFKVDLLRNGHSSDKKIAMIEKLHHAHKTLRNTPVSG